MESFHDNGPMKVRLLAFVIWAAVAASAVFWLLRLWSSSPTAPAHTVAVATNTPARGDLTRVFGAPPVAASPTAPLPSEPALASRFKLLGVAAPKVGGDEVGLALIAVDGKPPRGFKVGAVIDGNLVLQSVHPRGASLGPSGAGPAVSLELPAVPGAVGGPRPGGSVPPQMPTALPPGGGPIVSVPTAIVPPPPVQAMPPGMRPPEPGEDAEPQPVARPNSR
jgi:general secretion pathway protein C